MHCWKKFCHTLSPRNIAGDCTVLMDMADFLILVLTSLWCCHAEFKFRRVSALLYQHHASRNGNKQLNLSTGIATA